MGGFSDAVSKGRKQAAEERAKQHAADKKREAARRAAFDAGRNWIERIVRPVVETANADLENMKLKIEWELVGIGPNPSVKLAVDNIDPPWSLPTGRSITLTSENGQVSASTDRRPGGKAIGAVDKITPADVGHLLEEMLKEVGETAQPSQQVEL
jgi:hypothetical protein